MTGGSTLLSMVPRQSEMLCFPFRARSVVLKPDHWAVHRLISRLMVAAPQSTVMSELPLKPKIIVGGFFCVSFSYCGKHKT